MDFDPGFIGRLTLEAPNSSTSSGSESRRKVSEYLTPVDPENSKLFLIPLMKSRSELTAFIIPCILDEGLD